VLDVKIEARPTHAASLPVAMIPNCAATRHAHFVLDGSGPVYLEPPHLSHEFEVVDMPVTVAVDARGCSVHERGPREWRLRIDRMADIAAGRPGLAHETR
jgi:fumarate hydratase, class I